MQQSAAKDEAQHELSLEAGQFPRKKSIYTRRPAFSLGKDSDQNGAYQRSTEALIRAMEDEIVLPKFFTLPKLECLKEDDFIFPAENSRRRRHEDFQKPKMKVADAKVDVALSRYRANLGSSSDKASTTCLPEYSHTVGPICPSDTGIPHLRDQMMNGCLKHYSIIDREVTPAASSAINSEKVETSADSGETTSEFLMRCNGRKKDTSNEENGDQEDFENEDLVVIDKDDADYVLVDEPIAGYSTSGGCVCS